MKNEEHLSQNKYNLFKYQIIINVANIVTLWMYTVASKILCTFFTFT